ncbi:MAG: thioesterase [Caulobacter sp.]|nr:thioesterase [Caulobacter sp.]
MSETTSVRRWLPPGLDLNPAARMRLFCLPGEGGSAAIYRGWRDARHTFLDILPVELPGRGHRSRQPPVADLSALVTQLLDDLAPDLSDLPYALFGHGLGAALAFELARAASVRRLPPPRQLFLASARPPSIREDHPLHALSDADFIQALAKRDQIPREVLDHAELMPLVLPGLRADFRMAETWAPPVLPPLTTPAELLHGRDDVMVVRPTPEHWAPWFVAPPTLHVHEGGHFFLRDRIALLNDLEGVLRPILLDQARR